MLYSTNTTSCSIHTHSTKEVVIGALTFSTVLHFFLHLVAFSPLLIGVTMHSHMDGHHIGHNTLYSIGLNIILHMAIAGCMVFDNKMTRR